MTPIDQVNLSFNYQIGDDKFPTFAVRHTAERQEQHEGLPCGLEPHPAGSFFVGGETLFEGRCHGNIHGNRFRTGAVGSVTDNNPATSGQHGTDKNTTTYASVSAVLIPAELDFVGSMSNIDAHFWLYNVNPTTPTGGTAAQNLSATVENYPEVKQNLKPVTLALRFRYSADWGVTLRYQNEQYTRTDFRTSMPLFAPFLGLTGSLPGSIGAVAGSNTGQYHFLSSAYQPYTASWFTLLISYHPSALPFSKARSTF